MAEELTLVASLREETGSGVAGRLRQEGVLPAVVYGEGKAAQAIQVNERGLAQILRHHASGNVLVDIEVAGERARKALLKDVQVHPLTGRLIHADFQTISMSEKLTIDIPVVFTGEPVGVAQQGGTLEHLLRDIEVECLPGDIVESVELDVSELEIGQTLAVADIPLDTTKYTVLTAGDVAVAGVAAPRVEEEPEEEEEEAVLAEGAGPEVIGEKKAEEEGEGASD